MAKIVLRGNALTVTSEMKLEEIKFLEKYNAKALVLMGGEDNKEELFAVKTGVDSLSIFGASFGSATRDEAGKAVITIVGEYPADAEEAKSAIADKYGKALGYLDQIEAQVATAYTEAKAARDAVISGIQLA